MMGALGRHIEIRGVVQGVGFRPWIHRLASEQGLAGSVRNHASGVAIDLFGPQPAIENFIRRITVEHPAAAAIGELQTWEIPVQAVESFSIVASEESAERRVSIPPDLATCPECVTEIFDPANRRHRYPFTNCTNCGPRFTITREVPYDRPATTMAVFPMCERCRKEYEDPLDRRFHAQPNACPSCGPRLALIEADGTAAASGDPIRAAARALQAGRIVAIKGLGGFHLACDATSAEAIRRLRERKRRDEKPFAIMVRDPDAAADLAVLTDEDRRLLLSIERPIVIAERRAVSGVAEIVAPNNPFIGMMLPYSPLHHLLMHDAGRPLVMTSGNLSEEPLAYTNAEALRRLAGITDLFLVHDREIETRCDDSVARVIADAPVVLRRSRGFVPRAVAVPAAFDMPVLACGALLKNTFCFGIGTQAYLGPHIGDLENVETLKSFEESVERMQRFLRVAPAVVAYDMHPEYMSTAYAQRRPEHLKIAVQHHHAHVASVMAERGLPGPVIGVAFDGAGYGPDGTSWGGEVLVASYEGYERVATLRPVALAGGDAAIRHPWRVALALLRDAFDGDAPIDDLRLFDGLRRNDVTVVEQMLASGFRTPYAHGAGRYFDGAGSLVLARRDARYEGQIALEWNGCADPAETDSYHYLIDRRQSPWQIDLRLMIRGIVRDLFDAVPPPAISGRFHNTMVAATSDVVWEIRRLWGRMPAVLTGGCFQNALLAGRLAANLSRQLKVYLHRDVPPGDGGIALGQAVVAGALVRRNLAEGVRGVCV